MKLSDKLKRIADLRNYIASAEQLRPYVPENMLIEHENNIKKMRDDYKRETQRPYKSIEELREDIDLGWRE